MGSDTTREEYVVNGVIFHYLPTHLTIARGPGSHCDRCGGIIYAQIPLQAGIHPITCQHCGERVRVELRREVIQTVQWTAIRLRSSDV